MVGKISWKKKGKARQKAIEKRGWDLIFKEENEEGLKKLNREGKEGMRHSDVVN